MTTGTKNPINYKLLIAGFVVLLLMGGGIAGIYVKKTATIDAESLQRAKDLKAGPVVKTAIAHYSSGGRN